MSRAIEQPKSDVRRSWLACAACLWACCRREADRPKEAAASLLLLQAKLSPGLCVFDL
jgi:hypothetical protein